MTQNINLNPKTLKLGVITILNNTQNPQVLNISHV